ncbi:conjugative transposon protein TraJ [Pseudoflavitalea sp. X16]|uniref:conjugative transposon protein TraJ n=1 Tax=Paraflavitalea devenefica TaxID=2716334 RepID=UPI00141EDC68|nr:conjugative transposon protein TraJ [Paraflavitalea devenefica]NII26161.1 conjugative transposon protein TraJ [Paraflavitalea devenefica]
MRIRIIVTLATSILLPCLAQAQGVPEEIHSLHDVLDDLFDEMLVMSEELLDASRVIAGFAAVFYIGYRVWKHIANAEAIDFFPLLRPFALGFCISIFPQVISLMNAVLYPTVAATRAMVESSNTSIEKLIVQRQKELEETKSYKMYGVNDGEGDRDVWMYYTHRTEIGDEGLFGGIGNDIEFSMDRAYYNLKSWFKDVISFLLQLLYEAAALCINTIRTFNLLICALLGPFVFALSIFDGLQHSLTVWLARYINFYLWLPIANVLGSLLGKIQEGMIKLDLEQMERFGDTFFTTADIGYLVFMIIGIVAFFTVPNLSNLIINTGGGSILTSKVTNMTIGNVSSLGMAAAGGIGMAADAFGNNNLRMTKGESGHGVGSGYFGDKLG